MINLTYRTVSDVALNYLKSICLNITNYGAVPVQFKAWYSWTQTNARAKYYWSIGDRGVSICSASQLEQSYNSWMTSKGVVLDAQVTSNGLFNYFVALALWTSTHIVIVQSQLNSSRIICYLRTGNPPSNPIINEGDLAYAEDMESMIKTVCSLIHNNMKDYFIRYNTSMGNS